MQGRSSTAGLTGCVLQLVAALAVHATAAGCLPSARSLLVWIPVGLLALLVLDRVLAGSPLVGLAAGQLAAHAVLIAAACAGHGGGAAHAGSHVPMTLGHVAALVLCRVVLGQAVVLAENGVNLVLGLARRVLLVLRPVAGPTLPRLSACVPAGLVSRAITGRACVRGPPRGTLLSVT